MKTLIKFYGEDGTNLQEVLFHRDWLQDGVVAHLGQIVEIGEGDNNKFLPGSYSVTVIERNLVCEDEKVNQITLHKRRMLH